MRHLLVTNKSSPAASYGLRVGRARRSGHEQRCTLAHLFVGRGTSDDGLSLGALAPSLALLTFEVGHVCDDGGKATSAASELTQAVGSDDRPACAPGGVEVKPRVKAGSGQDRARARVRFKGQVRLGSGGVSSLALGSRLGPV